MSEPITRKTLARKIGGDMTTERIRRNEKAWGLHLARAKTGTRSVLYDLSKALEQLKARGLA